MPAVDERRLKYREFLHRETNTRHHHYDEEMLQYELLKAGDPRAVEEGQKMMHSGLTGHMVDDPVRNTLYLFIASTTLATRFAIEGGMDEETAYNISDLYIHRVDTAKSTEEILDIHKEMFAYFTERMARIRKEKVYSKQVVLCIDYIYEHLHERITVAILADTIGLNPSYLSTLFKKETGMAVSEYILDKRLETAETMLKYSDMSISEIASILSFSSQSHFTEAFKRRTGMTPREYRNRFFRSDSLRGDR